MGWFSDIVGAVAAPFVAPIQAASNIVQGGNVAQNVAGGVVGSATGGSPLTQANFASGGALGRAGVPIVSEYADSSSRIAAGLGSVEDYRRYIRSSGLAAGSVVAAPYVASQLGLGVGASGALSATALSKLSTGDFKGAVGGLTSLVPGLGDVPPELRNLDFSSLYPGGGPVPIDNADSGGLTSSDVQAIRGADENGKKAILIGLAALGAVILLKKGRK